MKKCIVFFILSLLSNPFFAQMDLPIVKKNNRDFYVYEVKEKETLYGISKKFDVRQEEIIQFNQQAIYGAKVGQTFYIPVAKSHAKKQLEPTSSTSNVEDFKYHVVQKGETTYSISRLYNVSVDMIYEYNPSATDGLSIGEEVRIPTEQYLNRTASGKVAISSENESPVLASNQHEVKPKETLYGISRMYGLKPIDLQNANPEIAQSGLRIGMILTIPNSKEIAKVSQNKKEPQEEKVIENKEKTQNESIQKVEEKIVEPINPQQLVVATTLETSPSNNILRIAVLLPFMLDEMNETTKKDATLYKFIEFYQGILIALSELKEKGYWIELNVFDVGKTNSSLRSTLVESHSKIKTSNLIIGPAYPGQVKEISAYAKRNSIPTIIPFAKNVPEVKTNPYLFVFNSPASVYFQHAADQFFEKFKEKNIVFVTYNNDVNDEGSEFAKFLEEKMKRANMPYTLVDFTPILMTSIKTYLSNTKENIVVLATKESDLVVDFLPRLEELKKQGVKLTVFGNYHWKRQTLSICSETVYYTPFNTENTSKMANSFNAKFKLEFGHNVTTIPRYDYIGYDIMMYFVKNLTKSNGKMFIPKNNEIDPLIQSQFLFRRQGANGGFVNGGVWLK